MITINSPYAEVRAVVDNHDNVDTPCGTIRAWVIGLIFAILLGFVNQLFSIRQPSIYVGANVAQLLAFPLGKLAEKTLPDIGFTLWGVRHSLNPGRFSKKEHMLITIMANVSYNTPYTNSLIWVQYLPAYFNQKFAGEFAYQILLALSTNFIGYGMAGIVRRFLGKSFRRGCLPLLPISGVFRYSKLAQNYTEYLNTHQKRMANPGRCSVSFVLCVASVTSYDRTQLRVPQRQEYASC